MVRVGGGPACLPCHRLIPGSETGISWFGQSQVTKLSVLELNRRQSKNSRVWKWYSLSARSKKLYTERRQVA